MHSEVYKYAEGFYKWIEEITGNKVNCHHCEDSYYENLVCAECNDCIDDLSDIYDDFKRHATTCKLSKDAKYKLLCEKCQPTYPCIQYECCSYVKIPKK
jgi:hypothetical protein